MLRVLVRKASKDNYFSIKTFNSLQDLLAFQNKAGTIILKHSFFYKEDLKTIRECFNVTNKVAKRIASIRISLVIYDDYIE